MSEVTIKLPENIEEITLEQYQRFDKLTKRTDLDDLSFNKRLIEIFTDLKYRDIGNISHKDYKDILGYITTALGQDAPFVNRFELGGVEFGFIPNLDDMSTAEFVDLSKWGVEVENFNRIMSVLFRPVLKNDRYDNYEIESYNGTEKYNVLMKQMPMNIVNGALGFFYHLAKELRIHTLRYTSQVQAREAEHLDTLTSGVGTSQSVHSLAKMS